jgi:hypothetical protein
LLENEPSFFVEGLYEEVFIGVSREVLLRGLRRVMVAFSVSILVPVVEDMQSVC